MEKLIRFIRRLLKLDSESMLHGGARLNHFWQAENRNISIETPFVPLFGFNPKEKEDEND